MPSWTAPSLRSAPFARPFCRSTRTSTRRAPTVPNTNDPTRRAASRKTPVPRTDRRKRALAFRGFKGRLELPDLRDADHRARAVLNDGVGEGQTGAAVADRAIDERAHVDITDGFVEAEAAGVGDRQQIDQRPQDRAASARAMVTRRPASVGNSWRQSSTVNPVESLLITDVLN